MLSLCVFIETDHLISSWSGRLCERRVSHPVNEPQASSLSESGVPLSSGDRPTSLIQALRFGERPLIVPPEVICLYVRARALSPKEKNHYSMFKQPGSNGSFFFINVQAITNSFAASFTRILVRIPFSLSRPLNSFVK